MADFSYKTWRNNWRRQDNLQLQHFGSDPADIGMRIRINAEIWIRIPDHFWLRFWRWRRFALSEYSLVIIIIIIIILKVEQTILLFTSLDRKFLWRVGNPQR